MRYTLFLVIIFLSLSFIKEYNLIILVYCRFVKDKKGNLLKQNLLQYIDF